MKKNTMLKANMRKTNTQKCFASIPHKMWSIIYLESFFFVPPKPQTRLSVQSSMWKQVSLQICCLEFEWVYKTVQWFTLKCSFSLQKKSFRARPFWGISIASYFIQFRMQMDPKNASVLFELNFDKSFSWLSWNIVILKNCFIWI